MGESRSTLQRMEPTSGPTRQPHTLATEPAEPAEPTEPPTLTDQLPGVRRRWPRRLLWAALTVIVLLLVATIGGGWYFSDQLLVPDHAADYPARVTAVNGNQVTLTRTDETVRPVTLALNWSGGHAVLDGRVQVHGDSIVRTVTDEGSGPLTAGLAVSVDVQTFNGDPTTARGMAFTDVSVHSELGELPAWFVPATPPSTGTTWVIAVHGYGSTRQESLRALPAIAATGVSSLVIEYRNDVGAPASPDGFYHLGDTEWRDVQSAVEYAQAHGATGIVLYGWSMGGGTVLTALRRMPAGDTGLVRAVVLDSPALDWSAILDLQGAQRSLPAFLTWTAKRVVEQRAHLSLSDLDQVRFAGSLQVPVLLFVDRADTTVPPAAALRLAAARPDLVSLVVTDGGNHTGCWNVDPSGYESTLRRFLNRFD
jgi:uncharacterized protein